MMCLVFSLILETRKEKLPTEMVSHLTQQLTAYLSHEEARVRVATGEITWLVAPRLTHEDVV